MKDRNVILIVAKNAAPHVTMNTKALVPSPTSDGESQFDKRSVVIKRDDELMITILMMDWTTEEAFFASSRPMNSETYFAAATGSPIGDARVKRVKTNVRVDIEPMSAFVMVGMRVMTV